jgi:ribosome-interacting GTPase 1
MARTLRFARVWGASVVADGQHVGREHRLADGDVLELHA